jgi:phosphoenolpyruvate carboxylase
MTINGEQDSDALMRSEIHRLGILLGQSLTRQEGPQLFELVEKIRLLSKDKPTKVAQLLAHIDLDSAIKLARAFSVYFHLANITEQFFRSQDRAQERNTNGTYNLIDELMTYNLVDTDDMSWHPTYVLTDIGREVLLQLK